MSECFGFSLSYKDCAADGALLTLGKSGAFAGRRYCRNNFFGVSDHVDLSCFNMACVISADSLFRAFLGAGCSIYYCPFTPCMTCCRNYCINITVTANRAGMCGIAACRAGRSGYNVRIIMFAGCRDFRF